MINLQHAHGICFCLFLAAILEDNSKFPKLSTLELLIVRVILSV